MSFAFLGKNGDARQPESRAFLSFGRKPDIKYFGHDLFFDSLPVVDYVKQDILPRSS
jgi:hypothetical protein